MKKAFILFVIALALLSLAGCGNSGKPDTANDVDLSKLSDEDLISLNESVQQEIVNRNIEKSVTLVHGSYYVGKDIPAGAYTFFAKASSEDSIVFYVYADDAHMANLDSRYYEYVYAGEDNTWALTLNDGELFTFDSGEITLTVSAGITFK